MPHGRIGLGGPLWWVLVALPIVVGLAALAVAVDAARRPRRDLGRLGRWPWLTIAAAYAAFAIAQQVGVRAVTPYAAGALVVAAVVEVAYLLRVVFPSPRRLEIRRAAQGGEGGPLGDADGDLDASPGVTPRTS